MTTTTRTPTKSATGKTTVTRAAGAAKPSGRTTGLTNEQIAARAYFIWQSKGCPQGQDDQNWREAEAQLKRE